MFSATIRKISKIINIDSTLNFDFFLQLMENQYITWVCFRNGYGSFPDLSIHIKSHPSTREYFRNYKDKECCCRSTCSPSAQHQENMSVLCCPLEPKFYIAKLGYAAVYLFFLFLLQNIDCGYSLEIPTIYVSSKNNKNIYFSEENVQFSKLKKSLYIAWASFRNG